MDRTRNHSDGTFAHWLVRLLGAVLTAAATLKTLGTQVAPYADDGSTLPAEWKAVLIPFEFVLGVWFLSGWGVRAARRVATVLFALFALVSWVAAAGGARSCGCFGPALVSPWAVLAFDVAAVLMLLRGRGGVWQPDDRLAGRVAIASAALVALTAGASFVWFGSAEAAVAALLDRPLVVGVSVTQVHPGDEPEQHWAEVTITNRTDRRVQIVAVQSYCECVSAEVPAWIEPGGRRAVRVTVKPPRESGPFARRATWLTTAGTVSCELQGTVTIREPEGLR